MGLAQASTSLHVGCALRYGTDLATLGHPVVRFDSNGYGLGDGWQGVFSRVFTELKPWPAGL